MATTTLVDSTFSASILGARTDNSGTAATDTTAEEARLLASLLSAGYITPALAFQVTAQTSPNMTVRVGSLTTKSDYYVLSGTVAGQGNYIVRLDVASQNVTITAADASQTRTDEIYLVVQDNAYDSSARVLPRIGYRAGTLGGANPGPDAAWTAYALLARITVAATVTTITNANISDQRVASTLTTTTSLGSIPKSLLTTKGDLIAASASATAVRLAVGTVGQVLQPSSSSTPGVKWNNPDFFLIGSFGIAGGGAASLTISGIGVTHTNLKILIAGLGDSNLQEIYARINGDSSLHYDTEYLIADGTGITAASILSSNAMQIGKVQSGTGVTTNEIDIANYSTGGQTHGFVCRTAHVTNSGPSVLWHSAARNWSNTSVISSITLLPTSGNFSAGMIVSLYGML
jgi:hypothetical protein